MKHVLLFTQIYPPQQGGAATFYSNLIRTAQEEIDFYVISEYEPSQGFIEERDGATLYRILPKFGWLPRIVQTPVEALILLFVSLLLVATKKIDLIHSHASRSSIVGLAAAATAFNIPIIYDCRDIGFRPRIIKTGPTKVWFSCASNIDQKLKRNGIPEERIIRLPVVNPEYVRDYRKLEPTEDPKELIFIGSIVERKGIFALLSAFERVRQDHPDVTLTVIGNGPARSEFEQKCHQKGIWKQVTMTGSLSHSDTLQHLAAADILVLPSESEGVPRVVLEGQEIGTPVVATSVGGIPDVIDHKVNGMLTEQAADDIAKKIDYLMSDSSVYQEIVQKGIEDADNRSWEHVGQKLLNGYQRAITNT